MAVPLARARGGDVHVLHVLEEDIVAGEGDVAFETEESARDLLEASVAELRESGMSVTGELLHTVGSHADVAREILRRAAALDAGAIVVGPETKPGLLLSHVAAEVARAARAHVIVMEPEAGALGRSQATVPAY
jgi:nucleotide-binding universal stress UspA family protein